MGKEKKGKTIAVVSAHYNKSQDMLRYDERIGLIPPINRTKSGIRDYLDEVCRWIELAKGLRSSDVTVSIVPWLNKVLPPSQPENNAWF